MKPVQKDERFPLSKIVSEKIKQYIIDNRLGPGQKLPSEREFVKMLNVSRAVLREALRTLESSGILTIRHGEGAFMQNDDMSAFFEQLIFLWKIDNKKRSDLLELRHIFELAAIEQIVRHANADNLDTLEALALKTRTGPNTKAVQEADIEFHRGLLYATNNDLFAQLTDLIVEYFSNVPHHHMGEQEVLKASEEHLRIVEALRNRDDQQAKQLLREHLEFSKNYIQDIDNTL